MGRNRPLAQPPRRFRVGAHAPAPERSKADGRTARIAGSQRDLGLALQPEQFCQPHAHPCLVADDGNAWTGDVAFERRGLSLAARSGLYPGPVAGCAVASLVVMDTYEPHTSALYQGDHRAGLRLGGTGLCGDPAVSRSAPSPCRIVAHAQRLDPGQRGAVLGLLWPVLAHPLGEPRSVACLDGR